ncbi:general substrate transporter [Naematelia encephala]|uniref:General substrate transporter n=1 Tax=Naematelia encephala TaxID=71784 RepID=A0A1Y2ARI5_9TREE|nr:general substrate transporter [Naematelia encephala]
MGFRDNWAQATPYLCFCVFTFACGDLIFGIDTSSFGSLQALPSWLNTFGTLQDGKLVLTTYQKAICNSVVFIGRLVGTTTFEPVVERIGFKKLILIIACLQIIAIIVELTARKWQVFTIGRVLAYMAVGYIENTVPTYSSEVAPPALRGFCSGLLTPVITLSSVWGAGMCQAYAKETRKIGWMVPVGVQMIPATMILFLVPFTVESPRWLLARGHREQAIKNLKRLRPKKDVQAGLCEAEIEALENAIEYDKSINTGRWVDLFRGTYLRRTVFCGLLFWFYQTTGNSFYNAYGPSFFVSVGLGTKSFTYATIVQLVGAIGSFIAIMITDITGRRPLIITGAALLILWNCLIAGLGSSSVRTTTSNNMVVASFILMLFSTKISWATHCFLVGSELGGTRMRRKIIMVGTSVDVFSSWLVSFTTPYIMNKPYGGIGGKIGYVFGGMAAISLVFAILFVPELKGRGLEEVDELFERRHWGWEYSSIKTSGYGAAIAQLENGKEVNAKDIALGLHKDDYADGKGEIEHVEGGGRR